MNLPHFWWLNHSVTDQIVLAFPYMTCPDLKGVTSRSAIDPIVEGWLLTHGYIISDWVVGNF